MRVDPGIRLRFSAHATDGYRCSMSSGEFDSLAGLEAQRAKQRHHRERCHLPRLPRVRRCATAVLAHYIASVLGSLASFLNVYGHEDLAHAKFTVRGRDPVSPIAGGRTRRSSPVRNIHIQRSFRITSALAEAVRRITSPTPGDTDPPSHRHHRAPRAMGILGPITRGRCPP